MLSDEVKAAEDIQMLRECVGHAVGMCQFRHYLQNTPGEKVLQFWMDMERFSRLPESASQTRWLAFREIQIKYFKMEGMKPVRSSAQWDIISGGVSKHRLHSSKWQKFFKRT